MCGSTPSRSWPQLAFTYCAHPAPEQLDNALVSWYLRCVEYTGSMADELQKHAANETASLRPPHSYVPWITVNGVALGGAFEELQIFTCAAYLGDRYDYEFALPIALVVCVFLGTEHVTWLTLCPAQTLQPVNHFWFADLRLAISLQK